MPGPSVIHWKCLDTLGLLALSKVKGERTAGVRLTERGLTAHVKRARRDEIAAMIDAALPAGPSPRAEPPPVIDPSQAPRAVEAASAAISPREIDDETEVASREETFVRVPMLPRAPRPAQPSLATIEMGLRKPTIWAVVLLSAGIAVGVGIAKKVSRDHARVAIVAVSAPASRLASASEAATVAWPESKVPSALATPSGSADLADRLAVAPAAPAPARAARSHRVSAAPSTQPPLSVADAAQASPATAAVDPDPDSVTRVTSDAVSTSALVQKELHDSLQVHDP